MHDDHALNEMIAAILIIALVIAMAALVFLFSSGMFSNLTKPTFIAPKISAATVSGKDVIDVSNLGGDVIYLNVPKLHYNEMGVYVDTPDGTSKALPLPGVDQFSPGKTLYIFKGPDGYRIADNPADLASPSAQSVPAGQVAVRLVDENSQLLLAKWGDAAGSVPSPVPTPTPTVTPSPTPSPDPVKAAFSRDPGQGVVPLTVRFTDASTGPVTAWHWTFGDGGTTVEQNPSHLFTKTGDYTVSLTVSNATGITDTFTWPGCVRGMIRADFIGSPVSGPAPLAVQFTDTSVPDPATWRWDFGDGDTGNSSQRNPVHIFRNAGTYTVKLTASDTGGSDTAVKPGYITVQNLPAPVAGFTGTPVSGTAPLFVQFTDTSTGSPTVWSWDFGDGDTTNSTLQNPAHRYTKTGSFTVTLQSGNQGGTSTPFTRPGYITVSSSPTPLTISWVWPDNLRHGHTHKDVDLEGTGFIETGTTRVLLQHAGEKDIEGEWVKVLRPTHLIFDLDLPQSATPGDWDLTVINPDGRTCTLKDGFEIKT
jgi:PKD repeat protein